MDEAILARWRRVLRNLDPFEPSRAELYVAPKHGCAADVVGDFLDDPVGCRKFLLIGATGGGKSSELREIARKLEGHATLVTIDLDASGINAPSVSAFDLLYMSGLQLLRTLPLEQAEPLFHTLQARYGEDEASALGDLKTSWAGLAQFAEAAGGIARAMGAAAAVAGVDLGEGGAAAQATLAVGGSVIKQIATTLGLRSKPTGVVAETSPLGRSLHDVCVEIERACRKGNTLPLCVLIDGLEK